MAKVGRPTELTDKMCLRIRGLILEGKDYSETRTILKIPKGTWDFWHAENYQAFAERLEEFKRDRRLMKSEQNIDDILDLEVIEPVISMIGIVKDAEGNEVTKINPNLLRIKADTSKFVAETLGKKDYSKRNEFTGKDGKDLEITPTVIQIIKPDSIENSEVRAESETIPSVGISDGQADD